MVLGHLRYCLVVTSSVLQRERLRSEDFFFLSFFLKKNVDSQGANSPFGVHIAFGDAPDEMVVMFYTKAASSAKVQFGRNRAFLSHSAVATGVVLEDGTSVMHTAVLQLLAPRKTYYYRCGNNDDGWSEVFHFVREGETMPDVETVTFLTYGDMGVHFKTSGAVLDAIQQRESLDSIDFIFHAGDLAYAFKNMTRWSVFLERVQPIASQVPYMVCAGNRDDLADVDKRYFRPPLVILHPLMTFFLSCCRFRMPRRGSESGVRNQYYSFQHTYLFGIVMAVGGQVPFGEASEQHAWLLKELEV